MNEYLSELYNWISSQDNTFQSRRSKEEFISKMQNDAEYNQQMYLWISGVDNTFKNRYTTEAFQSKTGLKKKDELQPTSQKGGTVSTTKEDIQPTSLESSEGLDQIKEGGFGEYIVDALDVGVSTVSKSIYDLPSYIYDAFATITNPIARTLGIEEASSEKFAETFNLKNIPSEIVGKRIAKKQKEIQEYNDKNGGDALSALENGNVLGAAKMVAGTTAQSLPLMIPAFLSGGSYVGLGTIGLSTASTKAAQLKEENPEIDVASRTINATATGMLEATLGQLLTGSAGAVTKRILAQEGSKKGAKIITDSFRAILEEGLEKSPVTSLFGEMLEEGLVSVGEQLTDISTGVKNDFDFREVINSSISATGMGGVNTVAIYGSKGYVAAKEYDKLKKLNKKLSKLSNELDNADLSVEEKDLLKESIERLKSKGKKIIDDTVTNVSLLPEEQRKELENTILNLDRISVSAFEINSNNSIPKEVKKVMLDELKAKAIELTQKKDNILSKNYRLNEFESLPDDEKVKLKEEAASVLFKEYQDSGQTNINITDDQISKKALDIFTDKKELDAIQEQEVSVVTEKKKEKVSDALNRPITLTELGGSKLDTPIEGDLYVEGQQVVIEDSEGNITEIGNINEISDNTLEEIGITPQESDVKTDNQGNLVVNGEVLVPERKGIKKDKRGNISRVVLRSPDGSITRTLKGANAEDAAYQILLKEATSPDQEQRINEILEQDEEFQDELRKAEATTQVQTDKDTEQDNGTEQRAYKAEEVKETTDAAAFAASQAEAIAQRKDDKLQVTPLTQQDVQNILDEGGKLFITEDGKAGAYVTADGYMGGLFKQPGANRTQAAKVLQDARIQAGGKFFDAFGINTESGKGTTLEDIYIKNGFRPIARMTFNPEFAPKGWENTNLKNRPDNVFFVYDPNYKATKGEGQRIEDYDQAYELAKNYNPEVTEGVSKLRDMFSKKPEQRKQVENAEKALKAVAPDVKIVAHESEQAYAKATNEQNRAQKTAGEYNPKTKTIHINPEKANSRTVAHETFHAILLNMVNTDAEAQRLTEAMMKSVAKVASPELKAYLDAFASNYDQNIRSEEKLAELVGKLASEYNSLPKPTKNVIKRWLDKLAKMFGLKPFTDNEVIDVLNTIAGKVARGEAITEQDVAILDKNKSKISNVNKRFQADFYDPFSGMTYMYDKNTNDFKQLKKDGYITTDKSITNFNGKYVFFHQPDAAFSGIISKNGEILVEGKGGMYYPIKFHKDGFFWASTDNAAQKMASDLNEVLEQNGGTIYMALTSAPYDKLLSSTTMSNAILDFFTSKMLDKTFAITNNETSSSIKKTLSKVSKTKKVTKEKVDKKTGKKIPKRVTTKIEGLALEPPIIIEGDYSKVSDKLPSSVTKKIKEGFNKIYIQGDLDATLKNIKEKLGAENSSFNGRKAFSENLINEMANVIKSKPRANNQFVKLFTEGIQNKYFKGTRISAKKGGGIKISGTNMKQALSEMLTEPILKDGVDRKKGGQIYAILEVSGKLTPVDSKKHESYPKALKAEGGKVKINILTDRVNWSDVTEDFETNEIVTEDRETKIYPTSGVSVRGLKINTSNISKSDATQSRKQVSGRPSIDEVRKFAKENNIPEADTRTYLKESGYTQDEIASFIEKEEDIYVKKGNKVVDWLKKTKRYLLSAKGFLPKNVFIAKEKKDQLISTEISIAERTAKRLNKLLKNQSEEVFNEVNNLMNGKEFKLPREIALVATQMREHIDSLSTKLVESGAVKSEESIENIKNNLGSYLNRSYKVFDDKDWASKVSEEVVQEAKQYLKKSWYNQESKLKMAEELSEKQGVSLDEWINKKVDQETNDIIKQKEANSFIVAATEGSKNLKVLKQRKEIPAEIRALMGEYNDPAYNYVVSVAKIINIVENQKFLEKIKDIGDGVFLFKEGEIRRGDDTRYVKVAAESNESLAPLNGYYMPKEIVEQLKSQDLITLKESWFKKLYSGWLKAVATVKKSKTIYSIGTHGKNVFGNARFMAQNGYLNPSDYNNAFKVLKNQFKGATETELNELLDKYKKLGVINQSVNLNEIRSMFSGNDSFDIRIQKRMLDQTENKTYKNAKQKLKNIDKFLEDMYQAEDDLFKIVAYENEKRDYSDILYNKKYEELTETEKQNVDDYVSNIVKNILPNYSRIGNLGKGLKFIPVTGTFISFQIEAYRTAYNTVGLAINEVKSDNPKMRTKGAKRLVALMAVEGLKQSLLYFLGASFLGDDDEEEKIGVNDVRPFLPEWAKNSDIIVTSLGDGKFSYVNVSASDPYGGIFQILNAAARGEDMSESIAGALKEFGDPVLSQDIFLSAIDDIVRNKTQYGGDLIEAGDDIFDKTVKITERLWTAFEPGTLTSVRKIMKSKEGAAYETIGQFTGLKPHTVDVEKILSFKLKDLKDDISKIKKEQYRAEYKVIDTGELGDLFEAYKNVDKKLDPVFKDANNSVKKAMRLGVPIYNIDKILTQKRFSNEDASLILFYDNLK